MVQELHVLRCYSCNIFQVQIVKKVNKWQCKICNEKQSLKKVYFEGSGKECRLQVQRMNLTKHFKEEKEFETLRTMVEIIEENHEVKEEEEDYEKNLITESKWMKYIVKEIKNENKIDRDNSNTMRNIDDNNRYLDSNDSMENNFLIESEMENSFYRNKDAVESSSNRNSSFYLYTNNDEDEEDEEDEEKKENNFNEINLLYKRKDIIEKRKFKEDKELDFDYLHNVKRIKSDDEYLERKNNLRDIIKLNRNDNCKLIEKDFVSNEYSVDKKNIYCESDVKKKTIFQSDFDDFDDNFDL